MKAGVVNCFKIRTFKPVYTPIQQTGFGSYVL